MANQANHQQQGLSLVELLVGMVLGLFLVLGVGEIFLANKTTFRSQEGMARIQEGGRFAMQRISEAVRSAGFFGCAGLSSVIPKVIASTPPAGLSSITTDTPIVGAEDVSAGTTIGSKSLVTGSDTITLRGTGVGGVSYTGDDVAPSQDIPVSATYSTFVEGDYVLVTDCSKADLFRATKDTAPTLVKHALTSDGTTYNISAELSQQYGKDTIVVKPYINTFFVADSGRDNYQGDDVMSLYQRGLNGSVQELVEGVSDLQVLYGVSTDADDEPEGYLNASQISAANWSGVVSVRISLLVDSIDAALNKPATYTFLGASVTPADKRLRKEFTGLFVLRNRRP